MSESMEPGPPPAAGALPAPVTGSYILIVEDEPDNREIMRAVVEEIIGCQAVVAEDGQEALRKVNAKHPSLILMDLMMPVLDGFRAIEILKGSEGTSAIPIVAVTALGRPADRQRALEQGADDYVSKPFDIDLLVETIRRLANLPAPEDLGGS